MDTNKEVLVPIWVLQAKIEKDHEEWMMFNKPSLIMEDDRYSEDMEEVENERPPFPEYDSTIKVLEILKRHGINFDPLTGSWSYKI